MEKSQAREREAVVVSTGVEEHNSLALPTTSCVVDFYNHVERQEKWQVGHPSQGRRWDAVV